MIVLVYTSLISIMDKYFSVCLICVFPVKILSGVGGALIVFLVYLKDPFVYYRDIFVIISSVEVITSRGTEILHFYIFGIILPCHPIISMYYFM